VSVDTISFGGGLRGSSTFVGRGDGPDAGKTCLILASGNFKGVAASSCSAPADIARQPIFIAEGQPDGTTVGAVLLPPAAQQVTVNGEPVKVSSEGVVVYSTKADGLVTVVNTATGAKWTNR
jgi:hypothetical protein